MTLEEKQTIIAEALVVANQNFQVRLSGDEDPWDALGYFHGGIIGDEDTMKTLDERIEYDFMYYDYSEVIEISWFDGKTYQVKCWGTGGD